jgi:cell division septation protein DedD
MAFAARAKTTRTTPTVKPLVTMNKKNNQSWELKLGMPQLVVLTGVLTGSMACAFGIGYVTGQRIGFENALESSVSSLPKYPIAQSGVNELDAQDVRDVYAELETEPFPDIEEPVVEETLPELAAVKSVGEEPVVDDLVVDLLEEDIAAQAVTKDTTQDIEVRVLGGSGVEKPKEKSATLGSLVPKVESKTPLKEKSIEVTTGSIKPKEVEPVKQETVVANAEPEMAKITEVKPEVPAVVPEKKVPPVLVKKPEVVVPPAVEKPRVVDSMSTSPYLRPSLARGWYAQVAAPQAIKDASGLADKLNGSGFPVAIEKAQVRGQTYFRVLVGPEDNRKQGEILLNQVKRERYLSGQPFIRMVK